MFWKLATVKTKPHLQIIKTIVREDVQIRRERTQRSELQSAYESQPKARLETKHGRSRGWHIRERHRGCCWCHIGRWSLGAAFCAFHREDGITWIPRALGALLHHESNSADWLAWTSSCKRTGRPATAPPWHEIGAVMQRNWPPTATLFTVVVQKSK